VNKNGHQESPITSAVAEEKEEEHFFTAGVIPRSSAITEKVAQGPILPNSISAENKLF
jgi:hypothetical protein